MTGTDNDWVPTLAPIPDPDSPAGQLAQELRELARTSKTKSLRDFAKLTHYSATRISEALSGKPRSVSEEGIKTICEACNADESTKKRLLNMRADAITSRPPGPAPADPPPDLASRSPSLSGLPSEDPPPPDLAPGDSPVPPGPARWKWLLVVASVVVLGAVGVVVWQWWPDGCGVFSGMRLNDKADSECIGISDGSYLFNDPSKTTNPDDRNVIERINDIEKRIETENNTVAGTGRYVKVVLLMPLTISKARPPAISLRQILYSLEGNYTALYRANHSSDFGDPTAMKIQLLLANQGSLQEAGPAFLDSIVKLSQLDHPMVTVIGLGSSVPNTKTAVEYLAQQGIPMVDAEASADSLTHLHLLWNVSPSNSEYVGQLKSFLDHQNVLKSGIIVYDRNPDLYTQSLTQDYRDQLGKSYVKFPDQPFQGSTLNITAAPDVFLPVVTNLCDAANEPPTSLDMVFYAGRIADFGAFTDALKARTCQQRPLTVLTGATGYAEADAYANTLASSNVKVVVATSSDSASWGTNEPGTPPGYAAFLTAYHDRGFTDDDLLDGYAIVHHDALATAAQAIRLAALGTPTHAPTPEDVAGQFGRLNLAYTVQAASGTLSFPPEGGRVTGQPLPLEQIK